ncbi:titin-like protein [Carex littledalei]|uniref:Titin-like protein n=1 Tax=Carex littledalei TaxID=544730 RepID=A0A833REY8_9POAL|nr:titin-like protein [Carex littledalei]
MATSRPTIDTAPKRVPNLQPRTSPPAGPTIPSIRKSDPTNTRRNHNAPLPLSPSTTKRSTPVPFSKSVTTTSTSHAKISPKPKKNPPTVITPPKKSHKESVQSAKPPSPKMKTETGITRSSSGIRTGTKAGNTSALIRGRSSVAGTGTKTVTKIGGTAKPTSKRCPSIGAKTGTKPSLSRVNSAPNLIKEVVDLHREEETEVPEEEEKDANLSPNLEEKHEETKLIPVPLSVEEEEEEEEKEGVIEIRGENEDQIETNAETEVKKEEKEAIEEVIPVTVTAELVSVPTIPAPAVTVSDVPVPVVPAPAVPVPAQGKKEAVISNSAIEVTRSKLVGERKSKVLALVGAFESVMSTD